jgi:hypothetical protein
MSTNFVNSPYAALEGLFLKISNTYIDLKLVVKKTTNCVKYNDNLLCRGENFMIKSLAELNIFLNNLNLNNKFVSVIAKKSWFQLSQQEQVRIKDDFHKMLNSHPGLFNHIKYLKSHNYYAHRISGNGETERIYFSVINNHNLMVEGIKCCLPLVPKTELNR